MIFGINTTSDISKLLYVISRAVRRVKFETILKYHERYLCQKSRTNHAIICLYYYPQNCRNFLGEYNGENLSSSIYYLNSHRNPGSNPGQARNNIDYFGGAPS